MAGLRSPSYLTTVGSKIVAVGRNFAAHARELGNEVPARPFFFIKPRSAYVFEGKPVEIPHHCERVDYEVELGVVVGSQLKDATVQQVEDSIAGYTVAIDMTARDIQTVLKEKRLVSCSAGVLGQ